jgi:hypothetical protein
MQYFISKSNFLRITRKYDIKIDELNNEIYNKPIYFLSQVERNNILSIKQFLINSDDKFVKFKGSGYIEDSYSYVHEISHHAKYHTDCNCKGLKAIYKDLEIPVEIKYKQGNGELDFTRIWEFRNWFKQPEITNLYHNNINRFIERLQLRFNLINPPKPIEIANSDVQKVSNYSEQEIEIRIDELIKKASGLYNKSEMYRDVLVKNNFSKKTYYVTSKKYKTENLYIPGKEYSNDEIRMVIAEFYNNIKKPIIDFLIDYWIIKLNPSLNFKENILEQLEFKACKICSANVIEPIIEVDIDDFDEIWERASETAKSQELHAVDSRIADLPF